MGVNLQEHWQAEGSQNRHIVSKDSLKSWHHRLLYNLINHTLNHINKSKVKTVLDWGCGGGLLSKKLKDDFHVSSVDISQKSLNSCIKYASPDYHQLVPPDINEFKWGGKNIDFIHCHALTWHFPSLAYFQKVVDIWVKLSPTYIAFNTKPSEKDYQEIEDKHYKKKFLTALKLNDDFVIRLLNEKAYRLINKEPVNTGKSPQTYFVFKK